MSVPKKIRDAVRELLWAEADAIGWLDLSAPDKSRRYDDWVVREDVGGTLGRYLDPRQVRVYLKDTVMKDYSLLRMQSHDRPFRVLGIEAEAAVAKEYVKPHGRLLADGRVVCWGSASNWKAVLMAQFERSRPACCVPTGVVLTGASGRYLSADFRCVVEEAARLLRVGRVVWLEM